MDRKTVKSYFPFGVEIHCWSFGMVFENFLETKMSISVGSVLLNGHMHKTWLQIQNRNEPLIKLPIVSYGLVISINCFGITCPSHIVITDVWRIIAAPE